MGLIWSIFVGLLSGTGIVCSVVGIGPGVEITDVTLGILHYMSLMMDSIALDVVSP